MIWLDANIGFKSFVDKGYARAGTIIEILLNNKKKQYLIGDVNPSGSFSKGKRISDDTVVLRYKVIWCR